MAAAIKSDIFENMRGALKYVKRRGKKEGNKLVDAPTHWLFFLDSYIPIHSAA